MKYHFHIALFLLLTTFYVSAESNSIKKLDVQNHDNESSKIKEGQIDRKVRRFGINLNAMGGTPYGGITLDAFPFKHIMLEVGIGVPSVSAGLKVFITNPIKHALNVYAGYQIISVGLGYGGTLHYFPIGITYIGKKRFQIGFDLGPARESADYKYVYGGFKIGLRIGGEL